MPFYAHAVDDYKHQRLVRYIYKLRLLSQQQMMILVQAEVLALVALFLHNEEGS